MKLLKQPILLTLLLTVQIMGITWVARYPQWVEQQYSNGIYPFISKFERFIFGWLPFSVGDVLYAALILWLLFSVVQLFKKRFKNILRFLSHGLVVLNVVYFVFHALWGLNYYRLPLHEALGIDNEYTTVELASLTQSLIARSNMLHKELQPNDSLAVIVPYTVSGVFNRTPLGYPKIEDSFPKLDYPPKSIKNSLFRYPLSVMGFGGYLNPFTNEAQINGLIPAHRWPLVSCHEQGHQLGFAKENEANFIGVMATTSNPDSYFKYSGYIFALRYCLSELSVRDPDLAALLAGQMRPGIFANYKESYDFWASYANPIEPLLERLYGNYLKVNNQPSGMQSYNYVVALLVNYFKGQKELP